MDANYISNFESVANLEIDRFYNFATIQLFNILTTKAKQKF